MGMLTALLAFGFFILAEFVVLCLGFGRSRASLGFGGAKLTATASVIVVVFGALVSLLFAVNPAYP